jgi:ATP-dependent Clp protease ATP-binding subunit ClpA/ATP-dependent Clp protease ATP-binding subunit ClpC
VSVPFTVGVFQVKRGDRETWQALVPDAYAAMVSGASETRLREELVELLRQRLRKANPIDHELFHLHAGTRLARIQIDVAGRAGTVNRRITGTFPLIVQPRWTDDTHQPLLVWHPRRPDDWFVATSDAEVAELAGAFARHAWLDLDPDELELMRATGKERLGLVSFATRGRSLLDRLPGPDARTQVGFDAPPERVLHTLAVDQTARAVDGTLGLGVPREPYRTKLGHLLGGQVLRSTVLVGRPGSGRTTLLNRWVDDRLTEDGFELHRNLDLVHHVWRLSGKRLIAGMSYLGDWEARCLHVVEEARQHRGILWLEDLHLFGRLGQSRQSERSLADLFRAPIQRGQLTVVATMTAEQLQRLEDDAPALAALLVRLPVQPATIAETQRLLLHEVRAIEARAPVEIHPFTPRAAIELGSALYPWSALPGTAIELLRKVAELPEPAEIGPELVIAHLARVTGLPEHLITLDAPLDPALVLGHFERRVMGQPEAVAAATDVVLKVRAGVADPARPLAVHLYTGPTGTGKTELATALAEYLYGDAHRLLRFDMSELAGPDAVARLIGDRWAPRGHLTERVREQPFAVVLLDEIEKAHPAVLALLLQLFDEGRLTDAAGDTTSFAQTVVIMTSNLGARASAPIGFGDGAAAIVAEIARAVRDFFPPELFNRIDRVVRFAPLSKAVAERIVDKELAKLFARRGLRDRNVFVHAGAAVRARAVAEAFDPRWGARTVKRWLEDAIGTLLADDVGRAGPARIRMIHLFDDGGRIGLRSEPMVEATAPDARWALEDLLDQPTLRLADALHVAARRARRVADSAALAGAREAVRHSPAATELTYYVEHLRGELEAIAARGGVGPGRGARATAPEGDGLDADARDELDHDLGKFEHDLVTTPRGPGDPRPGDVQRVRRFDRRSQGSDGRRGPVNRDRALADIAWSCLYARHLGELAEPRAHAVTVELSVVGQGASGPGRDALAIVTAAYLRPGWFDSCAFRGKDGAVVEFGADDHRAARATILAGLPVHTVVVLRDLFIAAALGADHGSHIVQPVAGEPAIVRVAISAGAQAPAAVLAAQVARGRAFEAALDRGGPVPENPTALLPVVRALAYQAPRRPGESMQVEIEDFTTGWSATIEVPDIGAAIDQAWLLRWSRRPDDLAAAEGAP